MGLAKSTAYIDSTLGYFCRRIVRATNLDGLNSLDEYAASNALEIYPIPASDVLVIKAKEGMIESIEIHSTLGDKVISNKNVSSNMISFSDLNLEAGIYFCSVVIDGHMINKKVIIK